MEPHLECHQLILEEPLRGSQRRLRTSRATPRESRSSSPRLNGSALRSRGDEQRETLIVSQRRNRVRWNALKAFGHSEAKSNVRTEYREPNGNQSARSRNNQEDLLAKRSTQSVRRSPAFAGLVAPNLGEGSGYTSRASCSVASQRQGPMIATEDGATSSEGEDMI